MTTMAKTAQLVAIIAHDNRPKEMPRPNCEDVACRKRLPRKETTATIAKDRSPKATTLVGRPMVQFAITKLTAANRQRAGMVEEMMANAEGGARSMADVPETFE